MDTWQHSFPCGRSATLANQIGRQVFCCAREDRDRMCGGVSGGAAIYSGGFHSFLHSFFVGQSPDNKHTTTWNRCLGYMLSMKWLNGENTQEQIECEGMAMVGGGGIRCPNTHHHIWNDKKKLLKIYLNELNANTCPSTGAQRLSCTAK